MFGAASEVICLSASVGDKDASNAPQLHARSFLCSEMRVIVSLKTKGRRDRKSHLNARRCLCSAVDWRHYGYHARDAPGCRSATFAFENHRYPIDTLTVHKGLHETQIVPLAKKSSFFK